MSWMKVIIIGDDIEKQMVPFKEKEYDGENDSEVDNPNAKWDWYSPWECWQHETSIPLKNGKEVANALIQDIDIEKLTSFALIYKGKWLQKGNMGWCGQSDTTDESEAAYFLKMRSILKGLPKDTKITLIEAHI